MDSKLAYVGGLVRILTSLIGGYLAQKGLTSEAEVEGIAGAIVLVVTGIWSIWSKSKALKSVPPVPAKTAATLLALLACSLFLSGCAVIHGSAGASRYSGFAFGEKASSTLAGLNITETTTEKGKIVTERGVGVDQSGAAGEADIGKILGSLLILGLQSQGLPAVLPAKAAAPQPAVEPEPDPETEADPKPSAALPIQPSAFSLPPSAPSGPAVAILGNRASCSYCSALWKALDAAALSAALGGAAVYDADLSASPALYAALRPPEAFDYPLVIVYGPDRQPLGRFTARNYTPERLAAAARALLPAT